MILTVTINPLLERRYYYHSIDLLLVNRNGKLVVKAGGKGINVNRQLNRFGIKNIAMLFAGGANGKILRDSLRKDVINFSDTNSQSETREAAIIIDEERKKIYSFFGENAKITSDEVETFVVKLEKAIATCEMVVFSGSSPCKEADTIFVEGINIAKKLDKISLCDTYGSHLNDCYNSSPTIIHNNVEEVRNSLGIDLNTESDHINFMQMLYGKGIKQAYVTDGAKTFYASNFDFHYKVTPPQINSVDSTGSGDAFVAGLIFGWHNKLTFDQQLRFATALGALNSSSLEVCKVELKIAKSLSEKISIKAIGKKLKEIDDSPN